MATEGRYVKTHELVCKNNRFIHVTNRYVDYYSFSSIVSNHTSTPI